MKRKIKVGFDISQTAHQGGVAVYTEHLAAELAKDPDLEMVFFYSSLRQPYKGKLKNVKRYRLPPTLFEVLFNKIRNVPIEQFIGPVDIFHSSDWVQPPSKALKVTTFHDVVPIKFPQWSHPKIVDVNKRRVKIVEQEIDQVIAVSQATKLDLIETTQIPASKITVVHEGVDQTFTPQSEEKIIAFRKKYDLPEEFVLSIGGIGERRNLKRVKDAAKNFNLIITGETIPWVSYAELPVLYSSAKLLFYPSFYEGFGLPILDAFACGLPVITSNLSSMPEVGGKAALYVDPNNESEMEKTLVKLFSDIQLRQELIKKGFTRVKQFSWEKCAKETAQVYKKLHEA